MYKFLILLLILISVVVIFWFAHNKYSLYNTDMEIRSSDFENNGQIPRSFTCDGSGINPALIFRNVPTETISLALLMDDPDAPMGTWDHWVIFNMPSETREIAENSIPNGIVGKNTRGENKYGPPCPPDREHRYFFKLYALDKNLALDENAKKNDVLSAVQGHILAEAELIGQYNRK